MKPRIFVAMPTTGGTVKRATTVSLYHMGVQLAARGIGSVLASVNEAMVGQARDRLAGEFLKGEATHLLFIDSDMQFGPDLCERLLSANERVIGAACTRRSIDFAAMKAGIAAGQSFDVAYMQAHKFNIRKGNITRVGNLLSVGYLGTGVMLIERVVFETMAAKLPLRHYDGERGFFDRVQDGNTLLAEDYSFCHRWRECGGQILVDPTLNVLHIGDMSYGFPLSKYLGENGAQ